MSIYKSECADGSTIEIDAYKHPPSLVAIILRRCDVQATASLKPTQVKALHQALGEWLEGQEKTS